MSQIVMHNYVEVAEQSRLHMLPTRNKSASSCSRHPVIFCLKLIHWRSHQAAQLDPATFKSS
jgi:hypothetical protein